MSYAQQLAHGWNLDQILMQLQNAEVCLCERTHIQFLWEELGQSLASEVEARREKNRERQRIKRERDTARDITRDLGQGRLGKDDVF